LGNQMFQYAAARRLSILHDTPLKLDITAFDQYHLHSYSLQHFCIREVFAAQEEIKHFTEIPQRGMRRLSVKVLSHLKPYYRRNIFRENHFNPFDPNINRTPPDLYLQGYWQSEKYFHDIKEDIKQEFRIRQRKVKDMRILEAIQNTESVSIHVRRNDYVSDPKTKQIHGTCSIHYYQKSMEWMAERLAHPHFFVFSDDPQWVKHSIESSYPMIVVSGQYTKNNYEDIWLMSMCKHHIIANSSFSWWSAWLSSNPDKFIIAPQRWFNDSSIDTRDLIPDGWIRL